MSDSDIEARLDAVERALTDGDHDAVADAATVAADLQALEERVADLEAAMDDVDAAVQAVRGYAGNVRAVNRDVERRASAALAKAETLETAVESGDSTTGHSPLDGDAAGTQASHNRNSGREDGQGRSASDAGDRTGMRANRAGDRSTHGNGTAPAQGNQQRHDTVRDSADEWPPAGEQLPGDSAHGQRAENDDTATDDDAGQTAEFVERVRDVL
jgi:hypothetical protein